MHNTHNTHTNTFANDIIRSSTNDGTSNKFFRLCNFHTNDDDAMLPKCERKIKKNATEKCLTRKTKNVVWNIGCCWRSVQCRTQPHNCTTMEKKMCAKTEKSKKKLVPTQLFHNHHIFCVCMHCLIFCVIAAVTISLCFLCANPIVHPTHTLSGMTIREEPTWRTNKKRYKKNARNVAKKKPKDEVNE